MPCSRSTLGLLVVIAALWLVRATGLLDLDAFLSLEPTAVLRAQLWRPLTAPLLANGILDLLFSGLALAWLAASLERFWPPREWLSFAALCVFTAGLGACALFPRDPVIPAGPALILVALLVARARLSGGERIQITRTFFISPALAHLLWAALILVSALASGLPLSGLVTLALSAATGWIYLSLRWRFLQKLPASAVAANRFGRLEL